MTPPVRLISLATAQPPHELPQADVARAARELFRDRFPQFERMAPVFETTGIRTRQSAMPMDWYLEPRGWPERMEAYTAAAVELFTRVAQAALDEAGLTGADIDLIVTVSSTGIATPSHPPSAIAWWNSCGKAPSVSFLSQ